MEQKKKPTEVSGLFWEMFRVIREVRPRWLLIENVPALRTRGADEVLSALEREGYACWPLVVGAWSVRAPHKRDRVFIVAYSSSCVRRASRNSECSASSRSGEQLVNTQCEGLERSSRKGNARERREAIQFANTDSNLDYSNQQSLCSASVDESLGNPSSERQYSSTLSSEQGTGLFEPNRDGTVLEFPEGERCGQGGRLPVGEKKKKSNATYSGEPVANSCSEQRQQECRSPSCNEIAYARWTKILYNQFKCIDESSGSAEEVLSLAAGEGLEGCWHRTVGPITSFPMPPGFLQYDWEHPRTFDIEEEIERQVGSSADGRARRMARSRISNWNKNALKALGNANPPLTLYLLGTAIMTMDEELKRM